MIRPTYSLRVREHEKWFGDDMTLGKRASTGIAGFDSVIDSLLLGDNVVWQVESLNEYKSIVDRFVEQSHEDGYRVVYMRFGLHQKLLNENQVDCVYALDPEGGFESFATEVRQIIEREGERVFYVFDCLSDLLEYWYSDLMIGNFFQVTCPFLFTLDTIAYFALMRGTHTNNTIARIRQTTQVLLDIHFISGNIYVHPLKVTGRYSPSMFFPHLIDGEEAVSITASSEAAMLFSGQWHIQQSRDYWEITLERAKTALAGGVRDQEQAKALLINLIIGRDFEIASLAMRYFTLTDLLYIAAREIGTGLIGGKSVGFLLARRILQEESHPALQARMEPHDSYYIGSDVFYTFIVHNGLWDLRMKQKTPEGYYKYADELKEKMLQGSFGEEVREQFEQMLEYFGQSPIIVRSSSLQEDKYGHAFAGKYESVFCANQGSPEERYQAFEHAVKTAYASIMNQDALLYRQDRGLMEDDEQMAILVQRVSGDHYGDLFFPHVAGVANSVNLYLWEADMDPSAGMIRLVFGLGTRAVDRVAGDYARIVALDRPESAPLIEYGEEAKYSQHQADVLDLKQNILTSVMLSEIPVDTLGVDKKRFFSPDYGLMNYMRESGRTLPKTPQVVDFKGLLSETRFASDMREILSLLQKSYSYPVDVEFATNFLNDKEYRINVLQCRPLQTKGLEAAGIAPDPSDDQIFFRTPGHFMGGNIHTSIDYVISVKPKEYLELSDQNKHLVGRMIGVLNQQLQKEKVLLLGPGRWGTTTTSLGVPIHFTELSHMTGICEVAYGDMMPELSFGSHFFQDLVESNVFYVALFDGDERVVFNPELLEACEEYTDKPSGDYEVIDKVIDVVKTPGLSLYSDVVAQVALCCFVSG